MKRITFVSVLSMLFATAAWAEPGPGHGIGLGAEATLGGIQGATIVYDTSSYRLDGVFGFVSVDQGAADSSAFAVAGRFFFRVHEMASSDLGVGGGVGFIRVSSGDNNGTHVQLEGGAQIRVFIVPNVALSGALGLAVIMADEDVGAGYLGGTTSTDLMSIDGQLVGSLGVTYFFR